jgi:hypothetical protein
LPKPQGDGTAALTPLELIDHLAALIPPPRRHRHRRALAPNAPLRAVAIAFGREVAEATDSPTAVSSPPPTPASNARSPARYLWVMLPDGIKLRLFESLPLVCPNCGADMRLIAFITEAAPVERILTHIGEPPRPPLTGSRRLSRRERCSPSRLSVARCPADAAACPPERARPHRPDARQPRSWALTEHSTPANLLPRANLDAQGGLDFLSVGLEGVLQ